MNSIKLTKKLISIPSYLGDDCDETIIGEFIFKYLSIFPWLKVSKQFVDNFRFNIIAKDKYKTKVLVCDHIDTVRIQNGWLSNPFSPIIKNGKLYGLGSSDTKSGIANLLIAIKKVGPTKGLMAVFYIDEEYNFLGMKKFIDESKRKIKPKLICSADGGDLKLGNVCRGLIEITFKIKGQSGHAAIPESGNNAIIGSVMAISRFKKLISKYQSKELGLSTLNLAWISGGQKAVDSKKLGKEGNIIPDYCQFVLEVRTADLRLNAQKTINLLLYEINKLGLKLISYSIKHDYGAWITPKKDLEIISKIAQTNKYIKADKRGYIDLQMLWQTYKKPICFSFVSGESSVCHKANEYVKFENLRKGERFWTKFIESVCQ